MSRRLWIVKEICLHFAYFSDNIDCTGRECTSPFIIAPPQFLNLHTAPVHDALYEYLKMGRETSCQRLENFCTSVLESF